MTRLTQSKATLLTLGAFLTLVFAYSVKSFTPPIFDQNSIAELGAIDVNGDEQLLLIRGIDRDHPVLLFVHGGPGMPAMYLAHDFQRELEGHFVVVHWDQRSSGKSFKANAQPDQLSTSRLFGQTSPGTSRLTPPVRFRWALSGVCSNHIRSRS